MKKQYSAPYIEKVVFDYKVQITTASQCYEMVGNEREPGSTSTTCISGTPFSLGWNHDQTLVNGDGN